MEVGKKCVLSKTLNLKRDKASAAGLKLPGIRLKEMQNCSWTAIKYIQRTSDIRLSDQVDPESQISVIGLLSVKKQVLFPIQREPHVTHAA